MVWRGSGSLEFVRVSPQFPAADLISRKNCCCAVQAMTKAGRQQFTKASWSPPIIPTGRAPCTGLFSAQVNRDLLCLRCFKGLSLKGLLERGRRVKRWLARLRRTKPKLQQPWVKSFLSAASCWDLMAEQWHLWVVFTPRFIAFLFGGRYTECLLFSFLPARATLHIAVGFFFSVFSLSLLLRRRDCSCLCSLNWAATQGKHLCLVAVKP